MPSRWWVPVHGIALERIRIEHIHAALSGWFDRTLAEHRSGAKPYTISPPVSGATGDGGVGIEVVLFNDVAVDRFHDHARPAAPITLGHQSGRLGRPELLSHHTWTDFLEAPIERCWAIELLTPTTFRSGDRSSPLPSMRAIMMGLAQSWRMWGDQPAPDPVEAIRGTWVSALDLTSASVTFPVNQRGRRVEVEVSGAVGTMEVRADAPAAPATTGLLGWAAYAGIGGMTRRGLGQVNVQPVAAVLRDGTNG